MARRFGWFVLIACGLSLMGLSIALWISSGWSHSHAHPAGAAGPAGDAPADPPDLDPLYVLVLGVDEREGDVGRSDTNVLLRLDPNSGTVSGLSIPRDTRVWIPGFGWDKFNAAYAHGGPALAVETAAAFTGLPVEYYVRVDVNGLSRVIDLMGGVEYNVEKRMRYTDPYQDLTIDLQPGLQRLDGERAMQYLRFRNDPEGDMGRIRRQQAFMKAVARQVLTPANLTRLPSLLQTVRQHVVTNVPLSLQLQAARLAYLAQSQEMEFATVPGEGRYVGEVSYYIHDEARFSEMLARWAASGTFQPATDTTQSAGS